MLKTFRSGILLLFLAFASALIPTNAIGAAGDLLVSASDHPDNSRSIRRFAPDGRSSVFVAGLTGPGPMAFDGLGNLYVANVGIGEVARYSPDGVKTIIAIGQNWPTSLCFDSLGNLYVANAGLVVGGPNQGLGVIVKITPEGIQSVFASNLNFPAGLAFDRLGNLFATENTQLQSILKISPAGSVVPFTSDVDQPAVLAFDIGGMLYETDSGTGNIYKFKPDGTKTLFTSGLARPAALALDRLGNVFVADANHDISKIAPDGGRTVFAPGIISVSSMVFEPSRGHPLNIASRVSVLTGNRASIAGFIIGGTDSKRVLIRGIGPSLAENNVAGALADPTLELRDSSGNLITSNNDWKIADGTGASQQAIIEATGMPPSSDREAAIVTTLPSGNSAYTAILRGKGNTTGAGLVEIYDLDQASSSKLMNISTRGFAEDSAPLIGGFIVGGNGATILVKAIGPSLGAAGVEGTLNNPRVDLFDTNGSMVAGNDNWRVTQPVAIEASGLAPDNDVEAAVLAVLPTGAYTAVVRGEGSGIAMVEMYNLN